MDERYREPYSGKGNTPMPIYGPQEDGYIYVSGFGFVPTPPDVAERQSIRSHGMALGVAFLLYFLALGFVPRWLGGLVALLSQNILFTGDGVLMAHPAVYQLIDMLTALIANIIPFLLTYRLSVKEKRRNVYPLHPYGRGVMALSLPVCLAVTVVASVGTQVFISLSRFAGVEGGQTSLIPPTDPLALFLFVLNMTVVPAIIEEMVFRGVIMQSLRKFSDPMALLVSTVLFSLAHGSFVKIPYTFLLGLCIGYFVIRTRSLLTGIFIHFFNNAYTLGMQMVEYNLPASLIPLFQMVMSLLLIVAGFVALLLLLNTYNHNFSLRPNDGYLRVYEQVRSFAAAPTMAISGGILLVLIAFPYLSAWL